MSVTASGRALTPAMCIKSSIAEDEIAEVEMLADYTLLFGTGFVRAKKEHQGVSSEFGTR